MPCTSCRSKDLVTDGISGLLICSSCGVVQDFNNYEHQFGGISGPQGTFVRVGTDYSYKERRLYQSESIIKDITYRLDLTGKRAAEVKDMIDKVTEGEFGLGDWFSVLVGACCYVAMRRANKPLPISEVVSAVDCDLYEVGKMVSRVVQFLGFQLPEFDIVGLLERMIRNLARFETVGEDKLELMVQQGNLIVQCMIKWDLTTGRRPGPLAVAVLVFVGELNGLSLKIEEVAKDADVAVHTCKKRYSELLEVLVKVAHKLPWGKDVNVKNIVKNAPFVIQYIDLKSREKRKIIGNKEEGSNTVDLEELLDECLGGTEEYGTEEAFSSNNGEENKKGRGAGVSLSMSELENLKISPETLARMYSQFTANASRMKLTKRDERDRARFGESDLFMYNDWWSGRSELCKKLMGGDLMKKDVGLDVLPPSYIRGCQQVHRRKQKIKAAKLHISLIASESKNKSIIRSCTSDVNLDIGYDAFMSDYGDGRRKRRKRNNGEMDWEDFIIETLLLHEVKEEEIEKGHYNTLLDLHVFNSGVL